MVNHGKNGGHFRLVKVGWFQRPGILHKRKTQWKYLNQAKILTTQYWMNIFQPSKLKLYRYIYLLWTLPPDLAELHGKPILASLEKRLPVVFHEENWYPSIIYSVPPLWHPANLGFVTRLAWIWKSFNPNIFPPQKWMWSSSDELSMVERTKKKPNN